MNFGEQIKKLRKDRKLTQQDMADQLGVSRQAVSNWENDKNLPDIEMLITMARVYHLTLDELILGGTQMNEMNNSNNMVEKLIKDSSETTRMRLSLLGIKLGAAMLALAFLSLIAGIWMPYSLEGYCGEAFTTLSFCGVMTFLIVGLQNMGQLIFGKEQKTGNEKFMAVGGVLVLLGVLFYALSLVTELVSSYLGFMGMIAGIALVIVGAFYSKNKKDRL